MMDERIARSRAQENRVAKRTGGSRNSGSGNGWKRKSDVRSPGLLWEMKRTDSRQITLKADDFDTVRKQAWAEGASPIMHLEFGGRAYVILEEHEYFELQDQLCH